MQKLRNILLAFVIVPVALYAEVPPKVKAPPVGVPMKIAPPSIKAPPAAAPQAPAQLQQPSGATKVDPPKPTGAAAPPSTTTPPVTAAPPITAPAPIARPQAPVSAPVVAKKPAVPLMQPSNAPAATPAIVADASENEPTAPIGIVINSYRFGVHATKQYERLVLEFDQVRGKGLDPKVTVEPLPTNGFTVSLSDTAWESAIPESEINDSYERKARYFGPLAVNTDDPNEMTLRVSTKSPRTKLSAFWLSNPGRLVIDMFPTNSPRARMNLGQTVAGNGVPMRDMDSDGIAPGVKQRLSATVPTQAGTVAERVERKVANLEGEGKYERIICFPAQSQLKARVSFSPAVAGGTTTVEGGGYSSVRPSDEIVCYPFSAQMIAHIGFAPNDRPIMIQQGPAPSEQVDRPPASAPAPQGPPPMGPPPGMGAPMGGPPGMNMPQGLGGPRGPNSFGPPGMGAPMGGAPPLGGPPMGGPPMGGAPLGGPPGLGVPPGLGGPQARPAPPRGQLSAVTPLGSALPQTGAPQAPPAANPGALLPPVN